MRWLGIVAFWLWVCPVWAGGLQSLKSTRALPSLKQKIALVVGINRSTKSEEWSPLRFARRDARRMAAALRKAQFHRIALHTTSRTTTRAALIAALQRLKQQVKSSEDMLVVYISAHGTVSRGRKRYIVTSDSHHNIRSTGLAVSKVRAMLRGLPSHRISLILATCYTGSARSKAVKAPGTKGAVSPKKPLPRARAIQILSAASFAQPAFESRRLRSDVYTHFFLDCFQKLANKTIINIHVCAAAKTTPFVKRWNGEVQVPKAHSELGANRDFYLLEPHKKPQRYGYFRANKAYAKRSIFRLFLLSRKSQNLQRQARAGEFTALRPGRYRVEVYTAQGTLSARREIEVLAGEVSALPSDWSLEWQTGGVRSAGILHQDGAWSLGALLGARSSYVALMIGVFGSSVRFEGAAHTQAMFEARVEGGYPFQWERVTLFVGAYGALGLWLQDVNQAPHPAIWMHLGPTAHVAVLLTWRWSLLLAVDMSLYPSFHVQRTQLFAGVSARLGLRFAFAGPT